MELTFENVQAPPLFLRKYRYGVISKQIWEAEVDQWIRIGGFSDVRKMRTAINTMWSGKRSLLAHLKECGMKLEVRAAQQELAFYVRKVKLPDAKE